MLVSLLLAVWAYAVSRGQDLAGTLFLGAIYYKLEIPSRRLRPLPMPELRTHRKMGQRPVRNDSGNGLRNPLTCQKFEIF